MIFPYKIKWNKNDVNETRNEIKEAIKYFHISKILNIYNIQLEVAIENIKPNITAML